MKTIIILQNHLFTALLFLFSVNAFSQTNMLTYAGNNGAEVMNEVVQLSNGNVLLLGAADNLNWVNAAVPRIQLSATGITNNLGTNKTAFILELDSNLADIMNVYHLPPNAAEDFRFLKTTNRTGQPTGDIYISGSTLGSGNTGGYFIGKLNNNFVNGSPTGFAWIYNVYAKAGSYAKASQPWDVGSDGKVVYVYGDSHDYDWAAIYRLKVDGTRDVVKHWRVHYPLSGGLFLGNAEDYPAGIDSVDYSAIVFKRDGGRCELRSHDSADYNAWQPDGNGGMKKGKWPLDVLFKTWCVPGGSNSTNGPGYSGYSPSSIFTYGPSSVCIDKRNNHIYLGFNAKSVLPGGQPDFEPAVIAMDEAGNLKWWSRLYHEVTPAGDTVNSTPDQYVDALAIDYSMPAATGYVVVAARCHGNNTENFWEGNTITANPGANGFQNNFTGSGGNFHLSWIGKLTLQQGTLMHSTYMGEIAEGATGLSAPSTDPLLDGWPSPNTGWPTLNTTYIGKNNLKVTADGSVLVLGVGRRTITTANAYQKMVKPYYGGKSAWNNFVRLYNPSLSALTYSSLVAGNWDTLTGANGDNVKLYGILKTNKGIVAVGQHTANGAQMPVTNVPAWGHAAFDSLSAVVAYYQSANMYNPEDNPVFGGVLPVSSFSFSGQTKGGVHYLQWKTTWEKNCKGFYLQKSRDGVAFANENFTPTRATNGNSTTALLYNYADRNAAPGITYYRLQQADLNGHLTTSSTVLLKKGGELPVLISCYPNPVKDQLNLLIKAAVAHRILLRVFDSRGREVYAVSAKVVAGNNVFAIAAKEWPAGVYYAGISEGAGVTFVKE